MENGNRRSLRLRNLNQIDEPIEEKENRRSLRLLNQKATNYYEPSGSEEEEDEVSEESANEDEEEAGVGDKPIEENENRRSLRLRNQKAINYCEASDSEEEVDEVMEEAANEDEEETEDSDDEDSELLCFICGGTSDEMVRCYNDDCSREWFHFSCLGSRHRKSGSGKRSLVMLGMPRRIGLGLHPQTIVRRSSPCSPAT